ncbi:MAG: hypothetical protein ACXWZG_07560, partial [Microbacterium sp.]
MDEPHGSDLADGLRSEGITIVGLIAAAGLARAADEDEALRAGAAAVLADADVVVLEASRATVSAAVVSACDRRAVRIVPLSAGSADDRVAEAFGLEQPLP